MDIVNFVLRKAPTPTLVDLTLPGHVTYYQERLGQRLGVRANDYRVLNIHRIGVEAPVRYVFEELLNWDGDSSCWPNHLAHFHRRDGDLKHIEVLLMKMKRIPFGFRHGIWCAPLFRMDAIKIQHMPDPSDNDNARFLLYACHGGYPIGFFAVYVRSPVVELNETKPAQVFYIVGFNFYGRDRNSTLLNRAWELIHNRVTNNVLNRFKQLCEWRFDQFQKG